MFDIDKKIKEWQDKNKQETGMPIVSLNRDTVQLLVDGAKMGMQKRVLANYAKISYNTLRLILDRIPELEEELNDLVDTPRALAIKNIYTKLVEGSSEDSWKYLEKKMKEEFGNKVLNENINIDIVEELSDEEVDNIKKQLRGE
jgi:hypothetical protein